jgi:hypothetical protein
MKPGAASAVSSEVGSIAFELISACLNGQDWETHAEKTKADDGSLNGGLEIHIRIKPPSRAAMPGRQPLEKADMADGPMKRVHSD